MPNSSLRLIFLRDIESLLSVNQNLVMQKMAKIPKHINHPKGDGQILRTNYYYNYNLIILEEIISEKNPHHANFRRVFEF